MVHAMTVPLTLQRGIRPCLGQAGVRCSLPEFVAVLRLGLERRSAAVALEVCAYAELLAKMDVVCGAADEGMSG